MYQILIVTYLVEGNPRQTSIAQTAVGSYPTLDAAKKAAAGVSHAAGTNDHLRQAVYIVPVSV